MFNKEELPEQWKQSIIVPVYKRDEKTAFSHHRGISVLSAVKNVIQHPAVKENSISRGNYWE
jgi:hypothetical protein